MMNTSPSLAELFLLLLLSPIMFNSISCTMNVQCNEKDMNILLKFKQELSDPSGMLSSWVTQHYDCCEWFGVHCDNITGRVIELNLPCHTIPSTYTERDDKSNCLTGELPLSLLHLQFLTFLNLRNNDFKGIHHYNHKCNGMSSVTHQPNDECVKLSNLNYLDLSYNEDIVIGNLHWISNISSLEYLNLNGINLRKETDWLPSLVTLPSLVELHLDSCQPQNIYPLLQYANFTSLKVLTLSENGIGSKLPIWLFNLSCDISYIDLSKNNIFGQLPITVSNLRSIKFLDLSYNNLDGPIPNWLGQLEHLQELYLSDNTFTGPIPPSLGNLSSLIELDLNDNNLNGSLPSNLGQLVNLKSLGVAGNSLTGIVSQTIFASLSNLKRLALGSQASQTFDFDEEWVPPFQLERCYLVYISPKLPSWLFTQSSLKSLTIGYSSFSLESHDKFWNFAQLEFLSLGYNVIDGDLSNVLINSKVSWLAHNIWRGGFPHISANVTLLNLRDNSLSGSLSPLLCNKTKEKSKLEYLDVSHNNLSGVLTDCWMHWKSLLHVDLGHNNLTGEIPKSMGLLSNLFSLHLNNNKLFGKVPMSLKNCQKLWILDLGGNKFSGVIPYWTGHSIKALQLRNNEFSGNIPSQICNFNSVQVLDFANNRLSGPIPNCLHNITSMVSDHATFDLFFIKIYVIDRMMTFGINIVLPIKGNELALHQDLFYLVDLSSNNLSGTIPSEIYKLTRLQSLNLSHNQLLGKIPQEIRNLNQLESIDLSSNHLSDEIPQFISSLSFLGNLNLSYNNFMGKIPSGNQLQSFTNLSYIGNPNLCGPPLTKKCTQVDKSKPKGEDNDDEDEDEVHLVVMVLYGLGNWIWHWILGSCGSHFLQ